MNKNERLEILSEKVRMGEPIGFQQALEVIAYQERLKFELKKTRKSFLAQLFSRRRR